MPKSSGTAGASNASREIRTVRDLLLLKVLSEEPRTATDCQEEIEMRVREVMARGSLYRPLRRLSKEGLVRNASTGRELTYHHELEDEAAGVLSQVRYTLTKRGREILNVYLKALKEY